MVISSASYVEDRWFESNLRYMCITQKYLNLEARQKRAFLFELVTQVTNLGRRGVYDSTICNCL